MNRVLLFVFALLALSIVACGPAEEAPTPTSAASLPDTPAPALAPGDAAYPAPGEAVIPGYPAPGEGGYPGPSDLPDGQVPMIMPEFDGKIVFHSDRNGALQLFTFDPATDVEQPIVTGAAQAYEPQWSPDCSSILYTHENTIAVDSEIYKVEANGQRALPFLKEAKPETLEWSPTWSPAGERIAYQTNPNKLINVCFADGEGSDLGCLEHDNYSNAHPSWSPDGSQLLFISNRDGPWNIYVLDEASGQVSQLTDSRATDFHPRFSPDGDSIVFDSDRAGNFDIHIMNADGSDVRRLTTDAGDDGDPFWLDDDRILFASDRTGNWEIYLMRADGSILGQITVHPQTDRGPSWCATD